MSTPIVFLHGWGQSRQVWHAQMEHFPEALFPNLPGHGGAAEQDDWIEATARQLPGSPAIIVGWSLGGIIAMRMAMQHPEKVAALVLVSTTPAFCNREGWEHGCENELFDAFEIGVRSNSTKTMGRFFALMLHGDEISRGEYNRIAKAAIDKSAPPSTATLEKGLNYLATEDLRTALHQLQQPVLVLHGKDDAIIPVSAGLFLAETLPHAEAHLFEACGHAPFLTQADLFNETLETWCRNI